jgi:formyl-CoA transferase
MDDLRYGPDYQNLHRGKRSLSLNLKLPTGREVLHRLARSADVFVENMRPGVKHRLGFDYESIRATNPSIVYGSISGFGQTGPYAERGGLDQIVQGMSGLMSVTGERGSGPMRTGIPIADLAAGLYLALGIVVALYRRTQTGAGEWVQTSLLESMIGMLDFQAARWTLGREVPGQEGNHHPTGVPMGCFATADGHLNLGGTGGRLWRRFCEAVGAPEWIDDARFATHTARSAHRDLLNGLIAERLMTGTTAEWIAVLNDRGVPAGPVLTMDQVFADEQVAHLGMVAGTDDRGVVRNPVSTSRGAVPVGGRAPELGEHTDAVLREVGLGAGEVAALRAEGVI